MQSITHDQKIYHMYQYGWILHQKPVRDHMTHDSGFILSFHSLINVPEKLTIVAGHVTIDVTSASFPPYRQVARVTEIVLHPENDYIYNADIALLRLQQPLAITNTVRLDDDHDDDDDDDDDHDDHDDDNSNDDDDGYEAHNDDNDDDGDDDDD
jgi:hypothetical protein